MSILNVFVAVGAVASSPLSSSRRLGRRGCLFIAGSLVGLGMLLLKAAASHHLLLVGRAMAGLGVGIAYPASYLFLHETALPAHRAPLAALNVFSLNFGALLILIFGWAFPYAYLPLFSIVPSLVFVSFVYFIPESAVFLLQNDQRAR